MSRPGWPNLVASTTRSRRPCSASPISVSLRPGSPAVHVGGVEEGDAGVDRGIEHVARAGERLGARSRPAEVVAAEADRRDEEAGGADTAGGHGAFERSHLLHANADLGPARGASPRTRPPDPHATSPRRIGGGSSGPLRAYGAGGVVGGAGGVVGGAGGVVGGSGAAGGGVTGGCGAAAGGAAGGV